MVTKTQLNLEPVLNALNLEQYGAKNLPRALVHFAMREILAPYGISHDRLKELTRIGGKNDCGIDGWFIDEETDIPILYLFQGKSGDSLEASDLSELWEAVRTLLDPNREKNAEAAQLTHDLTTWASRGLLLSMHFITTGSVGPAAQARADLLSLGADYQIAGGVSLPCEFKLWNVQDLANQHADLLRLGIGATVTEKLMLAGHAKGHRFVEAPAEKGGKSRTVMFLAYAKDIARIFNGPPKRWDLFREDPRGPLHKRNSAIWKTLQDPVQRGRFHTLNNGISVVCDDFGISDATNQVTIKGMRIVNGCQTTVTLGEALAPRKGQSLLDESVLVQTRVTKTLDSKYREAISKATNTQRQVTSADLASLRDEMRYYQELFSKLDPPLLFRDPSWQLGLYDELGRESQLLRCDRAGTACSSMFSSSRKARRSFR